MGHVLVLRTTLPKSRCRENRYDYMEKISIGRVLTRTLHIGYHDHEIAAGLAVLPGTRIAARGRFLCQRRFPKKNCKP